MSDNRYLILDNCDEDNKLTKYCKNNIAQLPGNDIETLTYKSTASGNRVFLTVNDCASFCDQNKDCKAFVFNADDNGNNSKCILKNSYYNIKKNDNGDDDGTVYTKIDAKNWNLKVNMVERPPVLQCSDPAIGDFPTEDDIKKCSDAVVCMTKNKELNSSIDNYNDEQKNAYNASKKYWDERKKEYDINVVKAWKDKSAARRIELEAYRYWTHCRAFTAPQCSGSSINDPAVKTSASGCGASYKRQCKYTTSYINDTIKNEFGSEPSPYEKIEIPLPKDKHFPDMNKTPNEENVNCCENIVNMGHGNATDVNQSCEQSIEVTNTMIEETINNSSTVETPQTTKAPQPNPQPDTKLKYVGISGSFIFLIILFSCFMLLNMKIN
jgi:hypothetical protein